MHAAKHLNVKESLKIVDGRLIKTLQFKNQTNKQTKKKKPYAKGNPTWCASAFKHCENITVEWIFTVFRSNAVTS